MPEGLENLKKSNELSKNELLLLNKISEVDERTLWLKSTVFDLVKDIQVILKELKSLKANCNIVTPVTKSRETQHD